MRPSLCSDDSSWAAHKPVSRCPKTYAYRVEGMPGVPPNTYMLCCHPIHGPVSFRPGSYPAPAMDANTEVTSTVLEYSPCPESPHQFFPWCQKTKGPYPGLGAARAAAEAASQAGGRAATTEVQGYLTEYSRQQYRQPGNTAPAQHGMAGAAATASLHFHIDPCRGLARCLANQGAGGYVQSSQQHPPPQTVRVSSQVQLCIQVPAQAPLATPQEHDASNDVAPKPASGKGKVLEDLRKDISSLRKQVTKVLESLTASHRRYCEEVGVEKQRRDSVLGQIAALNHTLASLQGPGREGTACERADEPAGGARWQPPDPCCPPAGDDDCPDADPVVAPRELCQRLAEWQRLLAKHVGQGRASMHVDSQMRMEY
ncbi:uncharacterized protein LOC134538749 [Bacillus rossius redtenbacheri]|uniref:uncharacterized protein LOC134538749 n=1 Tax=Bacillus rossius redtenbacheri TaxID=93214 RepID=UPI002FDE0793